MRTTKYLARQGSTAGRDRSGGRRRRRVSALLGALAVLLSGAAATAVLAQDPVETPAQQPPAQGAAPTPGQDALAARPDFKLPFECRARVRLTTYRGHNPEDKKIDMFQVGKPTGARILASAAGLVHEQFYPGGIEINHGGGWFTVYLHMKSHVRPGTRVQRGQLVGVMGNVGTRVVHLHYEQLYNPGHDDADNQHIVTPVIQGERLSMRADRPLLRTSANC
jgi:murein DD-endopeptidase MepM/ murein hydrolase activator NlpD